MVKGKSSEEKKTKMLRAVEKKRLRDKKGNKKRKLHPMGEDLSDYSDDDVASGLTPTERRYAENGANPLSNLHKKQKKDDKREKAKALREDHTLGGQSISEDALPPVDFTENLPSFKRCFWPQPASASVGADTGAATVHPWDPPSDGLKEIRKLIGVNVRGCLYQCPPPSTTLDAPELPQEFRAVCKAMKIHSPSNVQQQCWPAILCGANVLGISPTGSGKTLAYGLPIVPHIQATIAAARPSRGNNLMRAQQQGIRTAKPEPQALVLVPTRELAVQVTKAFKTFQKLYSLRSVAVYGGKDREQQLEELRASGGAHIVVATPGRLLDLLVAKQLTLAKVTYMVIDEADRMLQMGFFEQLQLISRQVRPDRQGLMFSATFPGKLREVCEDWIGEAVSIRCNTFEMGSANAAKAKEASAAAAAAASASASASAAAAATTAAAEPAATDTDVNATEKDSAGKKEAAPVAPAPISSLHSTSSLSVSTTVTQEVHVCATHKKPRLLIKFITRQREVEKVAKTRQPGNMVVFCTKIKTLKFVHDFLCRRNNLRGVVMIHGQMPQGMRERALNDFKAGKSSILLATDVAARGIHIKKLQHVVNYDFPSNLEQYCHRVGRTGRQGESGHSYSLITRNMAPMVADLVALLRKCDQTPESNLLELEAEFASGGFVPSESDDEAGEEEEEGAAAADP